MVADFVRIRGFPWIAQVSRLRLQQSFELLRFGGGKDVWENGDWRVIVRGRACLRGSGYSDSGGGRARGASGRGTGGRLRAFRLPAGEGGRGLRRAGPGGVQELACIDVRGQRAEEALRNVTELIDEAVMVEAKEVRILHGKGDGILRQIIREYLKTVDLIKSFGDEHIRLGGAGVTVVHLDI